MLRAVARYLRQAGIPFSDRYMEETLLAHAATSRRARRAVPRALRSRRGDRDAGRGRSRARSRRRSTPSTASTRTGSCAASCRSCARCCARTTSARADGGPKPYVSFKLDPTQVPLLPAAAAALRDLRALAAGRGRAPARRLGRPRRPALVGPARGLPHRGPRPDEGADGQERADRAGRREGRLRRQAPPADREALRDEVVACYTTFIRGLLDITDNDRRRRGRAARATWCATTATTRTSSSPPTRARRRSPTSPTGSRPSTASGSATRSPPAARRATTTRRWGSPRAARGCPSSATSASSASTSRPRTSPSSASATWRRRVRQRHAALAAHPARGGVRPPARLPRSRPGPGGELRRAPAAVRAAALVVGRLRRGADLRGRRRLPAHREVDRALAAGPARRSASTPSG